MSLDEILAKAEGPQIAICDTCGYRMTGAAKAVFAAWMEHCDRVKHPHVPGKGGY